ncbi:MAG: PAS domain S-box protein [Phycisphaeraceae bacterium]
MSAVVEAAHDAIGIADAAGRIIYFNSAGRRLIGVAEDAELSNTRIADYHPPWAADLILREGLPAATRDGSWQGETALLTREGAVIPTWQVIVAHQRPEGEVDFYSTIMRDLTDRRKIERLLEEAHTELESRVAARTAELERINAELQAQIAERRQAELLLKQSQDKLAEAHRIAKLGNWEWHVASNQLHWSDEVYRIFGLNRKSFAATYDSFA